MVLVDTFKAFYLGIYLMLAGNFQTLVHGYLQLQRRYIGRSWGLGVGIGWPGTKRHPTPTEQLCLIVTIEILYTIMFKKRSYAIIFKYGSYSLKVIFNFLKHF